METSFSFSSAGDGKAAVTRLGCGLGSTSSPVRGVPGPTACVRAACVDVRRRPKKGSGEEGIAGFDRLRPWILASASALKNPPGGKDGCPSSTRETWRKCNGFC